MKYIVIFLVQILFVTSAWADIKDQWYVGGSLGVGTGMKLDSKINIDWPSSMNPATPVPSSTTYKSSVNFNYTFFAGKDFAIAEKQSLGVVLKITTTYGSSKEGENTMLSGVKVPSGTKISTALAYSKALQAKYAYYFMPNMNVFVKLGVASITVAFKTKTISDDRWYNAAGLQAFAGAFGIGGEYIVSNKHGLFVALEGITPFKVKIKNDIAPTLPKADVTAKVPVLGYISFGYRYIIGQ